MSLLQKIKNVTINKKSDQVIFPVSVFNSTSICWLHQSNLDFFPISQSAVRPMHPHRKPLKPSKNLSTHTQNIRIVVVSEGGWDRDWPGRSTKERFRRTVIVQTFGLQRYIHLSKLSKFTLKICTLLCMSILHLKTKKLNKLNFG